MLLWVGGETTEWSILKYEYTDGEKEEEEEERARYIAIVCIQNG